MSAVMQSTEVTLSSDTFKRTERLLELCAFEVRQRDRQMEAFFEEQQRVRVVNTNNDSASVAVFHGGKQMTRRERMLAQHREEIEQERRYKARRAALALRRVPGVLHFCRHCNSSIFRGTPGDKCQKCKNDPALITARGTETRSFVPRREAQPSISPLSAQAGLVLAHLSGLDLWLREPIELRYFERMTDHDAAKRLGRAGVSTAVFAGYVRAGIVRMAHLLANSAFAP